MTTVLLVILVGFLLASPARVIIICDARPVLEPQRTTSRLEDPITSLPVPASSTHKMEDIELGDMDSSENQVNFDDFDPLEQQQRPMINHFKPKEQKLNISAPKSSRREGSADDGALFRKGSYVDTGFILRFQPITAELDGNSPMESRYRPFSDRSGLQPMSILDEFTQKQTFLF